MRIFAFHLLNDFSGSPKVLAQLTEGWSRNAAEVHLCTSFMNTGFLSDVPEGVVRHSNWYRFHENRLLRLLALLFSQFSLMATMFNIIRRDDIVYVNTVLPFGAALLGWIKGCRVIYHVHEVTVKPLVLKRFLFGVLKLTARELIFVSEYLSQQVLFPGKVTHVLHNAIPDSFLQRAQVIPRDTSMPQNVLMICSLKVYKGVNEFVELARSLKMYRFRMVVNASALELNTFFDGVDLPPNLELFPAQRDVVPHYAWADLIVNLSHPDGWIETFGLTIIEGMAFGLPAIVPEVGGIVEVVDHGYNGYHADSRNVPALANLIHRVFLDTFGYKNMSENARRKLEQFREQHFIETSMVMLAKPGV
jgi:L-malate glycosyltransferase